MKTVKEIVETIEKEYPDYDSIQVRDAATQEMRRLIATKLKLEGSALNPARLAGVNTDHIMALFKYVIDLIFANATDEQREEVWEDFIGYRDLDITARHYDAYVQTGE